MKRKKISNDNNTNPPNKKVKTVEIFNFYPEKIYNQYVHELDLSNFNLGESLIFENYVNSLKYNIHINSLNLNDTNIGLNQARLLGEILHANNTLTSLDLGNNPKLGDKGIMEIFAGLKENKTLTNINLSHTNFKLDDSIFTEYIKKNNSLKILDISENQLNGLKIGAFIQAFPSSLETLKASNANLKTQSLKKLSQENNLTYLDLSFNPVTEAGLAVLGNSLENNKKLKSLIFLSYGRFERKNLIPLFNGIKKNTSIKEFIIGAKDRNDQTLDRKVFEYLNEALKDNNTLTSLSFHHLNITGNNIINLFQALTKISKVNSSLQYLSIKEFDKTIFPPTGFNPEVTVKIISKFLQNNPSLTTLYLEQTSLPALDAGKFFNNLKENTTLKSLTLKYCNFSFNEYWEDIKENSTLTFLDISYNQLYKIHALELLSNIFKGYKALRELNLERSFFLSSSIKREEAINIKLIEILQFIKVNSLNLSKNDFLDLGDRIFSALAKQKSLTSLNFNHNYSKISYGLEEFIENNPNIKKLYLAENSINNFKLLSRINNLVELDLGKFILDDKNFELNSQILELNLPIYHLDLSQIRTAGYPFYPIAAQVPMNLGPYLYRLAQSPNVNIGAKLISLFNKLESHKFITSILTDASSPEPLKAILKLVQKNSNITEVKFFFTQQLKKFILAQQIQSEVIDNKNSKLALIKFFKEKLLSAEFKINSDECSFFRQIEKINLPPDLNTNSLKWHMKANYFYVMGVCKNFSINFENYKLELPVDIIIKIADYLKYSDVKMPIYDHKAVFNSETDYKLIAEFSSLLHPEEKNDLYRNSALEYELIAELSNLQPLKEKEEPNYNSAVEYELIAELSNLQQYKAKGEYISINEYPVIEHCSLLGQDLMH